VFCPLSPQSLSDEDYFPELVEFLEENSVLGDSLIFQLDQGAIGDLGRDELGGLKILGRLGFGFALDGVTSLDADYAALRDHFFRFVKIDADRLLDGASGPVASRDMTNHLDRFDLKLVAGNVGSEHGLSRLMEIGVELAEGALFASPRPANAALFRELEDTGTAFV
jgi:cyclic-di-GMP phosphodiesterase TipF (flagellum assembly factor)